MDFIKKLLSVICSLPIIVFGLVYIFLWVVPLDIIKQNRQKKQMDFHPLPMQNLIDQVNREGANKPSANTNEWGGA